jgi:hypothetical protein
METCVQSVELEQFTMGAPLTDLAVVEHQDFVGSLNGAEAMCDGNRRTTAHE